MNKYCQISFLHQNTYNVIGTFHYQMLDEQVTILSFEFLDSAIPC